MTAPVVAFIFAGVAVICGTVLSATGHAVPPELWTLAGVGVGGGAGVAIPTTPKASVPS
jgi:hypothetical protein